MTSRVFPNLRRMHEYWNLPFANNSPFISLLLSRFVNKIKFPGNVGTYKIAGAPPA
jgi:hypothetical protein